MTDYNLYVKKDYPEPDECIYGIITGDCLTKCIINLLLPRIPKRDLVRDEWGDIRLCKVCRRDFVAVQEFLLSNDNIDELDREIALEQLNEIVNSCSDADRLILELC